MLTKERLQEMLQLQERLEVRIDGENWREKGHDYALCVHMECAEIIEHHGWKHWKNVDVEPDLDAIAMEVVDVWHFLLAFVLRVDGPDADAEDLLGYINGALEEYNPDENPGIIPLCIGMSFSMFAQQQIPFGNFIGIMDQIDMDFDQLYILYISKNVLNWFRQDNGYREGKYLKNWGGREDNEHLQVIADELGDNFNSATLYVQLSQKYQSVIG